MRTSLDIPQLIEEFISTQDVAPNTRKTYKKALRHFFTWAVGFQGYDERTITTTQILEFKAARQGGQRSSDSLGTYLTAMRRFYSWAVEKNYLSASPMEGIKNPNRVLKFKKKGIPTDKISALLARGSSQTIQAKRDRAILHMMAVNALRCTEVALINIEDLGYSDNTRTLQIQGKGKKFKEDQVKLTHQVDKTITEYLTARRDYEPADPLFTAHHAQNTDRRISARHISGMVKKKLKAIGVDDPKISAHSLRHSVAYAMLRQKKSEYEVMRYLRHTDIRTTQIYMAEMDKIRQLENTIGEDLLEYYNAGTTSATQ